jgi:magnesium transporter
MKIVSKEFQGFEWVDIEASQAHELDSIAEKFGLKKMLVHDSVQFGHLPKYEKTDDYHFLILRGYTASSGQRLTTIPELSNKIAFFFNEQRLITIHRAPFEFLDSITPKQTNVDSLLWNIISELINTYETPGQWLNGRMDVMERIIFLKDSRKVSIEELYYLKSQVRVIKKLLVLTQHTLMNLDLEKGNRSIAQDVKDRLVSLVLTFDEISEDAHQLMNTYLSVAAQRNNDVMRLLTIFSAFFLPLTFIVGVYGMNFDYFPELKWERGYFYVWSVMIGISVFIFVWFKRKKII